MTHGFLDPSAFSDLLILSSNSVLTLYGLILALILNLFKLRFLVLGT